MNLENWEFDEDTKYVQQEPLKKSADEEIEMMKKELENDLKSIYKTEEKKEENIKLKEKREEKKLTLENLNLIEELLDINEEIRALDIEVHQSDEELNELKYKRDLEILKKIQELEETYTNNKELKYSTIQKRETIAKADPIIKGILTEIAESSKNIDLKKIEINYLKRKFKIYSLEIGEDNL
jgi:hypothetical protein